MKQHARLLIGFLILSMISLFFSSLSPTVGAKKTVKKVVKTKSVSGGALTYITKLRNRTGIVVTFRSLKNIQSISYMLSYETNGKPEGALGTLTVGRQKTISRRLLFGTCSSGVCRYHPNVKNAILEVTSIFKNGRQAVRTYRIR